MLIIVKVYIFKRMKNNNNTAADGMEFSKFNKINVR